MRRRLEQGRFTAILLATILVWTSVADAFQANVAQSTRNMVATVSPLATEAGVNALRNGGNAIDAAVAAALTLGVVDGYNSGIGGGCFHPDSHRRRKNSTRSMAEKRLPRLPFATSNRDQNGELQPERAQTGARAVAVPGALKAMEQAVIRHGRKTLPELLEPAAKIAEQGFEITPLYSSRISNTREKISQFPETAKLLLNADGTPLAAGEYLVQPDLAATYRNIATKGTDWFYHGPFAATVSQWMRENDGVITESDFANYEVVDRAPVATLYRDLAIVGFPPPSSGGIHVAQILNIVERFDLQSTATRSRARSNPPGSRSDEVCFRGSCSLARRPGLRKRTQEPGLKSLRLRASFADRPRLCDASRLPWLPAESGTMSLPIVTPRTSQRLTMKATGVAITSTINTTFGSKVIVPGTGVFLNNEMDDFAIAPWCSERV